MRISLAVILLVMVGCATYQERLQGFIGRDINSIIASNGVPTKTMDLPNGDKAYEWFKTTGSRSSMEYNAYMDTLDTNHTNKFCRTTLVTSKDVVKSFSWQGNICY